MSPVTPERPERARLKRWLQTALELELATIPPYLVALLSIRLPGNREGAERIRSVMLEEMLHMVLVSNVLNAIGGHPRLDARAAPRYPLMLAFEGAPFRDRRFPIDLAPFSEDTVRTFLQIELPREREAKVRGLELDVPAATIGEFYDKMGALLDVLEATEAGAVYVGDPARQFEGDYFWSGGGRVIPVHDLASAKAALHLVAVQGEGAWPRGDGGPATGFGSPFDMGHYYRFNEIAHARRYQPSDDPAGPPTGAPIAVDFRAVDPFKVNPTAADYPAGSALATLNGAFNARYTTLLMQLHDAMNGAPKSLYDAIMDHMHALTPIAHEMMKTPLPGHPDARTGCPTFEWV